MKFYFLIGALCLSSIKMLAADVVKLSGKISNQLADSVSVNYDNGGIVFEPTVVGAALTKDGQFTLTFSVKQPFTQVSFYHGNQTTMLVVQPGDDLALTLDGNSFDSSLRYDGKGKEIANFMALDMVAMGGMYDFTGRAYGHLKEGGAEFEKSLALEQQKETEFYAKYGEGLPPAFAAWWKNYYIYSAYQVMLNYPFMHEMALKQTNIQTRDVSKENFEVSAHVPMAFNDAFVSLSSYRQYATAYFMTQLTQAGVINSTNDNAKKYLQDDSVIALVYKHATPKTAELTVGTLIFMHAQNTAAAHNEARIAQFKKRYPKSENIAVLEKRARATNELAEGKPEIDFAFKTMDGRDMHLSDLKGSVVLIDFWASWCGPCKAQMPASRKLEEHFKDKKVVFLYVSVDEDADKWKEAIKKYDIKGLHTRVDGVWNAEAVKKYGINGVPSYFIVDKAGNFGVRDVPRPDQGDDLKAEIEKLLK
jgi:thiol-disulfide isomerase/thioredoxin